MKRRLLLALCVCMIGAMGTVTGCSSQSGGEEDTAASVEDTAEKEEEELKTIGTEDADAFQVELKNSTEKNITGVSIKLMSETEYPENMLTDGDVYEADESRILYYKAPDASGDAAAAADAAETEAADSNQKVMTTGYDVQLTFEDASTAELHAFPFEDISEGEICFADDVAYLSYTSVSTEEKVETKEAELSVKAQKEAEAQAAAEQAAAEQAAAEQAAAEAAAAQAAAEQAAAEQAAAEQAAAEAAAQAAAAAAQQQQQAAPPADTSGGGDGCLDGALFN